MSGHRGTILSLIGLNPNKFGSYEEFELKLMERMAGEGLRHVKAFLDYPQPELRREFERAGAVLDVFPASNSKWTRLRQAAALIRKHRPDAVHLAFFAVLTPLVYWARLFGVRKIVFTDHSSGMPRPKSPAMTRAFETCSRFNANGIDRIIAVSKFVARRLQTVAGVPESKVRVVYNGINTARFSPAEIRPDCIPGVSLPEGRPVYTVVANLIREKGIDVFLRAAKLLVEGGRPGIFLIVGTGDRVDDLRRLAGELHLNDRVFFLGVHSDVERIHRFTDIFIGPSLWQEAFGLANIEAMSCALPVISTRVGAIPEVVEDGVTGILVEPGDVETLAAAMRRLEDDPALRRRMGDAGRRRVESLFTLDRQVEQSVEVFLDVLNSNRGGRRESR